MPSYLITGASRGLGYAFLQNLASNPENTVIGLVRNKQATQTRLSKDNITNATIIQADITDRASLRAAFAEVSTLTKNSLDHLINNAALVSSRTAFRSLVQETTEADLEALEEDFASSFRANVIGLANTINTFLPLIRASPTKKIIVISTGMADLDLINEFSVPIAAPYSVSKAAANALVAKYNAALGKSEGILVLALSPGLVDTSEEKAMSEEEVRGAQAMGGLFKEYAPDFKGPISPEESVRLCLGVIEEAKVETHGGGFVSHLGNRQWL